MFVTKVSRKSFGVRSIGQAVNIGGLSVRGGLERPFPKMEGHFDRISGDELADPGEFL